MDVFLSALAGALVGSFVSIVATVATLRSTRTTTFAAIRLQDALSASSEMAVAFQEWMRSVVRLYGPLGRPGDDELQEVEMRARLRLVGLRHRLPGDFDEGLAIDRLLEDYHRWVMSWLYFPDLSPEQTKLPDQLSAAAGEVAEKLPEIAKRLRAQLGERTL